MKSVVMRTCYGILSMSKELNLLTFKYDVITLLDSVMYVIY